MLAQPVVFHARPPRVDEGDKKRQLFYSLIRPFSGENMMDYSAHQLAE